MLLRGQEEPVSFRRILIGADGGTLAAHAAEVGIELAVSLGAAIAFVHVIDPALTQATGITPGDLIAADEQEGRRLIAGFSKLAPQTSSPLEFIHVGKPAAEIVKTAKQWPADLIVIGSHARHGIQRALLGSVAEAVLHRAPCPVLVIRSIHGRV
jgi:nucleotide-binding universal stress UspA family protein